MKTKIYAFSIFLLMSFTSNKGQHIEELGYYDADYEILALSSKPNLMIINNGHIVDISDPSKPQFIDTVATFVHIYSILISEEYLYIGCSPEMFHSTLLMADISNPETCTFQSCLDFCLSARSIICSMIKNEDILYVATTLDGIYSVDVSDIAVPKILDTLNIGTGGNIAIKPPYAYIVTSDSLKIADISNPLDMHEVAGMIYYASNSKIDINDNLLFLGKSKKDSKEKVYKASIDVYNISDPLNLTLAFSVPKYTGRIIDIKYHKNHIYVVNNYGLSIYRINNNSAEKMAEFLNSELEHYGGALYLQDSLILLGLRKGVAILQYNITETGLNPDKIISMFNIYPNPSDDIINVEIENPINATIEIYSVSGKLVFSKELDSTVEKINISGFSKGIYIIEIRQNSTVYFGKVVVR